MKGFSFRSFDNVETGGQERSREEGFELAGEWCLEAARDLGVWPAWRRRGGLERRPGVGPRDSSPDVVVDSTSWRSITSGSMPTRARTPSSGRQASTTGGRWGRW